jgi:murein DD-endopeptidase MepM/ murein hydrolase activator NlpD
MLQPHLSIFKILDGALSPKKSAPAPGTVAGMNGSELSKDPGIIDTPPVTQGEVIAPGSGRDEVIKRLQARQAEIDQELQARKARRTGLEEQYLGSINAPAVAIPDAPQYKQIEPINAKETGGALLAALVGSFLGVKPRTLKTGVDAFMGTRADRNTRQGQFENLKIETDYKNAMKAAQVEMDKQERDQKALGQRLTFEDRGITELNNEAYKTDRDILVSEDKEEARRNQQWARLTPGLTDPRISRVERQARWNAAKASGIFDQMTPEELDALYSQIDKDGSTYTQKQKEYDLKVDAAAVNKKYKEWQQGMGDKQFDQRVKEFNAGWTNRWQMQTRSLDDAWSKFLASQEGQDRRAEYGTLNKEYEAAVKNVQDSKNKLRDLKTELEGYKMFVRNDVLKDANRTPSEKIKAEQERVKARKEIELLQGQISAAEVFVGEAERDLKDRPVPKIEGASNLGNSSSLSAPLGGALRVTSWFGPRNTGIPGASTDHRGIDFGADAGTPILAVMEGVVEFAGTAGGYGNAVYIRHADGTQTRYGHMSKIGVKKGQKVGAGANIGAVGSTGVSSGPHLHFEVRDSSGKAIDPAGFLGIQRPKRKGKK